jgi:hypothetical protein
LTLPDVCERIPQKRETSNRVSPSSPDAEEETAMASKRFFPRTSKLFGSAALALAALSLVWPGAVEGHVTEGASAPAAALVSPPCSSPLSALPHPAQAAIAAALGREHASYHVTQTGEFPRGENIAQNFKAGFSADGVLIRTGEAEWKMQFTGIGYGEDLDPAPAAAPRTNANRVEYRRGAVTEWYVNSPLGLEQGFTIDRPPIQEDPAPGAQGFLTLALALSGDLTPTLHADGRGVSLARSDGATLLRYSGLAAFDARGRELPAWMELRGTLLSVRVDDTDAAYPIIVDPTVEGAILLPPHGSACYQFGRSVAISGDTIVVGADEYLLGFGSAGWPGSAYVFVKPAGGWTTTRTYAAKLRASDGAPNDRFGISVAISGDTVVVGAHFANGARGAAYVFEKPAGGWSGTLTESARLTTSEAGENTYYGVSVAVSGDTVIVGTSPFGGGAGAAYLYTRPVSGWADTLSHDARLVPSGGSPPKYGESVSISGDVVVVGCSGANGNQGAAYVFLEPAGGWSGNVNQSATLTASPGVANSNFGFSVAISGDAVVVGAYNVYIGSYPEGKAYVFVKPGGGWAGALPQTATLSPSDGGSEKYFGFSVAISNDVVAVGAVRDMGQRGSAYFFMKPSAGWSDSTETFKVYASGGQAIDYYGSRIAIGGTSLADFTMVVGSYQWQTMDKCRPGAAYVYGYKTRVNSIARYDANPFSQSTVHWTVTFESPVVGGSPNNYELFGTAASNAAITSVTGSDFTRTVTAIIDPPINGSLGLRMANAIGLDLEFGNLPFNGESYTMAMVPTRLAITGSNLQEAGTANDLIIRAQDDWGNAVTTYSGDRTLIFSGANPSSDPVTLPTVADKSGVARGFGANTVLHFANGEARVSGSSNGRMILYRAEDAFVTASDGTIDANENRLNVAVYEAAARQLVFVQQPTTANVGAVIAPPITVHLLDAWGNQTVETADVNMSIANNPGGGSLGGTTTVSSAGGIAAFADLSISTGGAGYTLGASSAGMTSGTSATFDVIRYNTATTITADSPDPSVVGQVVTVSFSVTSAGGTPTGNVTVTASGGSESCTGTVAAGSCTIALNAAGARTLRATYAGDANFNGSTSASEPHTVNRANTMTTVTADSPDPSVVGQSVMVSFSVTSAGGAPTGNVTVTASGGSESCTGTVAAGSCTITLSAAGARTLTATYGGDANFQGSTSAGEPHSVTEANSTTTITADSPDPSLVGQAVTVSFGVTSAGGTPTGNVTVTASGGSESCTGTVAAGSCTIALSAAGARTLTATYGGDANFQGSTSAGEPHSVTQANSTTTITADGPDPSVVGQAVTVSFSVTSAGGAPTGNVTVTASGGSESCTGTVGAGRCDITLSAAGARTLTAVYGGDTNFNGSTSGGEPHTVGKANSTTTITSDAPAPSVVGQSVTVSFTVAPNAPGMGTPTGNVTVTASGGTESCTDSVTPGSCAITLVAAGIRSLTAGYAGDADFNGSPSAPKSHTVTKADTDIAVSSSLSPSLFGELVIFTAAVRAVAPGAGTPTGTVQFKADGAAIGPAAALTGGVGSVSTAGLPVGRSVITAEYGGDSNFNASAGTLSAGQAVNRANTTTTVSSTPNPVGSGHPVTFIATVSAVMPGSGTPGGTVTFLDGGAVLGTGTLDAGGRASLSASGLGLGAHSITAEYGGEANFFPSNGSLPTEQTVNPVITTIAEAHGRIEPSGQVVVPYGGSQTFTITPDPGYHIETLVVDGSSVVPVVSGYPFTGVSANHTISATFLWMPVERHVCLPAGFCPYQSIQAAVDDSGPGDTIMVARGVYGENIVVATGKEFTIQGGWDVGFAIRSPNPSLTVIDGDVTQPPDGLGDGSIFILTAGSDTAIRVNMDNMALTNGNGVSGGGIFVHSTDGGSVELLLRNSTISRNQAVGGGGIYAGSSAGGHTVLSLSNSFVVGNEAELDGGGILLHSENPGSVTTLTLVNNTITGNRATAGGGLYASHVRDLGQVNVTAINDVLWGNRAATGGDVFVIGSNTQVDTSHSDVGDVAMDGAIPGNFTAVENVVDVDPVFVNTASGDYRLNSDSPLREKGSSEGAPGEDFEGQSRGPAWDIGADQYVDSPTRVVRVLAPNGSEVLPAGGLCNITWQAPPEAVVFRLRYQPSGVGLVRARGGFPIGTVRGNRHYPWIVPTPIFGMDRGQIQVTGYTAQGRAVGTDTSDRPYEVKSVQVSYPVGGETLRSGTPYPIRWETYRTTRAVDGVKLYYSANSGRQWTLFTHLDGNPGHWDWMPEETVGATLCKVKVVLVDRWGVPIAEDLSPGFFTIWP